MKDKLKLILIILLIIVLGITIYVLIPKEEKYFNKIELEKTTYVLNRTDQSFMDTIVYVGLTELNLSPQSVLIRELTNDNLPKFQDNIELQAYIYGVNHQYLIYIRKVNREKAISILSHELIHLKQEEVGDMVRGTDFLIWKGKKYTNETVPPYLEREWEIEAFENEKSLRDKINQALY